MAGKDDAADDVWVFAMLESLRNHSLIWDPSCEGYKSNGMRKRAWEMVSDEIFDATGVRKTTEVLKKRYGNIRDESTKKKKKVPTGSSAADVVKKCKYDDALSFLDAVKTHRKRTENLPPPTQLARSSAAFDDTSAAGDPADSYNLDRQNSRETIDAANLSSPQENRPGSSASDTRTETRTNAPTPKRRRRGTEDEQDPFVEEALDLMRRCAASSSSSDNQYTVYGSMTTRILSALPKHAFRRALSEFFNWASRYEGYEDESASSDDD